MLTLIRCPSTLVSSQHPAVLPKVRVAGLNTSSKRDERRKTCSKHADTLDPTKSGRADCAAVQAQSGNLSENKLICNTSGNTCPQLSQLAEPLWTDPGLKSAISVCELISTSKKKKKKKCRWGMNGQTLSQKPRKWKKSVHHYRRHTLIIQGVLVCLKLTRR